MLAPIVGLSFSTAGHPTRALIAALPADLLHWKYLQLVVDVVRKKAAFEQPKRVCIDARAAIDKRLNRPYTIAPAGLNRDLARLG